MQYSEESDHTRCPSYVRLFGRGVRDADRRAGEDSRTLEYQHDAALCQILGAVDRARNAEDERADVFWRYIVVESISGSSDEKRAQRRAGSTCPSLLFYICKSVGTYQRCDVPTNLRIYFNRHGDVNWSIIV